MRHVGRRDRRCGNRSPPRLPPQRGTLCSLSFSRDHFCRRLCRAKRRVAFFLGCRRPLLMTVASLLVPKRMYALVPLERVRTLFVLVVAAAAAPRVLCLSLAKRAAGEDESLRGGGRLLRVFSHRRRSTGSSQDWRY